MLITTGVSTLYSGFANLTKADVRRLHTADIDVHVWPLTCAQDVRLAWPWNSGLMEGPPMTRQRPGNGWPQRIPNTSPQTGKASSPDHTTGRDSTPRRRDSKPEPKLTMQPQSWPTVARPSQPVRQGSQGLKTCLKNTPEPTIPARAKRVRWSSRQPSLQVSNTRHGHKADLADTGRRTRRLRGHLYMILRIQLPGHFCCQPDTLTGTVLGIMLGTSLPKAK
jgi:hypothetical protein